jgi:hypothetical protein
MVADLRLQSCLKYKIYFPMQKSQHIFYLAQPSRIPYQYATAQELSQTQLAEAAGISRKTPGQIETDRGGPRHRVPLAAPRSVMSNPTYFEALIRGFGLSMGLILAIGLRLVIERVHRI